MCKCKRPQKSQNNFANEQLQELLSYFKTYKGMINNGINLNVEVNQFEKIIESRNRSKMYVP